MTQAINNTFATLHTALTAPLSYNIVAQSLGQKDKNRETVFTLSGADTHVTFRVRRPKGFRTLLIDVMTGSDNEGSYEYVGSMNRKLEIKANTSKASQNAQGKLEALDNYLGELRTESFNEWKRGKFGPRAYGIKATSFTSFSLSHSGTCTCCGRTLTNPESLETGIGPVCQGRLNNASRPARNASDLK
jgi:hypothetical protein